MSNRSFVEAIHLEDQPVPNEEFEIVSDTVASLLSSINNSIQRLEKDLQKTDGINYQASLNLINTLILNFKQLNITKNELITFDDDLLNQNEIFAKDKLFVEINKSLKVFNKLQTKFTEIEKKLNQEQQSKLAQNNNNNNNSSLIDFENESENSNLGRSQQQQQQQFQIEYDPINSEEVEYQQNLINERALEIDNIANSILEINEIYQDLNTMVQEQGLTVDSIENNLFSVVNDTKFSRNELVKANNYQKRKTGRCFWLLVILSVLFFLILLTIIA